MKLVAFVLAALFCVSFALASVDSSASGVFRGSLRHTVTIDGETTVANVNAGDFISFKVLGNTYDVLHKSEDLDVYIRRYSSGTATYDLPSKKFNEVKAGNSFFLDVDEDGAIDAHILYNGKNSWTISPPCSVACATDDDCKGTCLDGGTCDARCVAPEGPVCCKALIASCLACSEGISEEAYCAQNPETIGCPQEEPIGPAPLPPTPEQHVGWFTRLLQWFATLF